MAHVGRCFCGAVEIAVSGAPQLMGYCHCESCRSWSAGPVNAFSLWPTDAVSIVAGVDRIGTFHKTPASLRKYCTTCGGHVMTDHPAGGVIDVYAATIPTLDFQPSLHLHYGETVLHIADGLPKFRDVPAEFGGSGETMAE